MDDHKGAIFATVWLVSVFCSTVMGRDKGRPAKGRPPKGLMLGLLLGPVGAIAATWMDRSAPNEARHRADVERLLALYRNRLGLQATDHPGRPTNGHGLSIALKRSSICPVCSGLLPVRLAV